MFGEEKEKEEEGRVRGGRGYREFCFFMSPNELFHSFILAFYDGDDADLGKQ